MKSNFTSYDAASEYLKYRDMKRKLRAELITAEDKESAEWKRVEAMEARTDDVPMDEYNAIYDAYEMAIAIRKDIEYKMELAEQAMELFKRLDECLSDIEYINNNDKG